MRVSMEAGRGINGWMLLHVVEVINTWQTESPVGLSEADILSSNRCRISRFVGWLVSRLLLVVVH